MLPASGVDQSLCYQYNNFSGNQEENIMHPAIAIEVAQDRAESLQREAREIGRYRRAKAVRKAERRLRRRSTASRRTPGPGR
jgi:hypothetical protein